jgi:glycosyltransferase involved in cell wall biosynthesis
MLTEERFPFLIQGIANYLSQTYEKKELVIVLNRFNAAGRKKAKEYIQALNRPDIRVKFISGKPSLGKLRDTSLEMAKGPLCCIWDDDDLHHPRRLDILVSAMLRSKVDSVHQQIIFMYFKKNRRMYIMDWDKHRSSIHVCPGTGIFRKDPKVHFARQGKWSRSGEDFYFLYHYRKRHSYRELRTHPYLYVYLSHGYNTASARNHLGYALDMSPTYAELRRIRREIEACIDEINLPKGPIHVMSPTGKVFTYIRSGPR